jgi:hypothetical protein
MQHFLKAATRPARARILSAELFFQGLVTVDGAQASLDLRL